MRAEAILRDEARREVFTRLVEEHHRIVLKVANTYCRLPHDRDDLAQEIISQLWRAFPSYDPDRRFSTWMYRIALNVAISEIRSRKRHSTVSLDESHHAIADDVAIDAGQEARVQALYRFIETLDQINRAMLLLYMEEKSYREMAEILGISETNVATKINRLKTRMKNHFENTAG